MSKTTIAPVLTALLEDLEDLANGKKPHPEACNEGDRRVLAEVRVEVRALKGAAALLYEWPRLGFSEFQSKRIRALARLSQGSPRRRTP